MKIAFILASTYYNEVLASLLMLIFSGCYMNRSTKLVAVSTMMSIATAACTVCTPAAALAAHATTPSAPARAKGEL